MVTNKGTAQKTCGGSEEQTLPFSGWGRVKNCEVREELLEREELLLLKAVKTYKRKGAVAQVVDQDGKCVAWVCYSPCSSTPSSTHAHGRHH